MALNTPRKNKKNKNECGTVDILPESDERTLCVSLAGLVCLEDYEKNFLRPLEAMVEEGVSYGLLIHYSSDYKGWTPEAADRSFQSIIDYGQKARKLAYVNPPESKIFQVKMAKPLLGGEIRLFNADELPSALSWIKS